MGWWFKNSFLIVIFSHLISACSIDMIAGKEDVAYQSINAPLTIVPAFRTHLSHDENPRLSEQFAIKNQTALRDLDSRIRQLNRITPKVRHTLVTENNDFNYNDYIRNWKSSIELYVNSQYPKGINYQRPDGNALIDVAITKSGKLFSYNVILTTGSSKLNSTIKNIIHHNLPFAPLSAEIRKNTDVLHITQMWQFRK